MALGWDVPKLDPSYFTEHFGFVSDFLAECWSQLRRTSRLDVTQGRLERGSQLSGRDRRATNNTVNGLLKLLWPDPEMEVPDDALISAAGWPSSCGDGEGAAGVDWSGRVWSSVIRRNTTESGRSSSSSYGDLPCPPTGALKANDHYGTGEHAALARGVSSPWSWPRPERSWPGPCQPRPARPPPARRRPDPNLSAGLQCRAAWRKWLAILPISRRGKVGVPRDRDRLRHAQNSRMREKTPL